MKFEKWHGEWKIFSHGGLYYLLHEKSEEKAKYCLVKSDQKQVLEAWIDGFDRGLSDGRSKEKRKFESGELIIYNGHTFNAKLHPELVKEIKN